MRYRTLLLSWMLGLTLLVTGCSAPEEIPETAEPEPQEISRPQSVSPVWLYPRAGQR